MRSFKTKYFVWAPYYPQHSKHCPCEQRRQTVTKSGETELVRKCL